MPLDILIYAVLAAVLLYRLHMVLGTRTGEESSSDNVLRPSELSERRNRAGAPAGKGGAVPDDPVAALPLADGTHDSVRDTLRQIAARDRGFASGFVEGARAAFGLIVTAFAEGRREQLRPLLNDRMYEAFSAAIDAREKAGETITFELRALREVTITDAEIEEDRARVELRLVSDQINVTNDASGQPISGSPDIPEEVVDLWTFARNLSSRDPNWELVRTRVPDEA